VARREREGGSFVLDAAAEDFADDAEGEGERVRSWRGARGRGEVAGWARRWMRNDIVMPGKGRG
jgi:hypothetical protein